MKKWQIVLLLLGTVSLAFGQSPLDADSSGWKENGHFVLRDMEKNNQYRFDIRMYIDGGLFFNDSLDILSNGTHLRKARFAAKTKFGGNWSAEWDMDIAEYSVEIKDMWLAYNMDHAMLKLGHFKMPLGLETLTSSRLLTFVERAYISLAFKMDRRTGMSYTRWGDTWHVSGGLFAQPMDDDKNQLSDETGNGYAIRGVYGPKFGNLQLHLGTAFSQRTPKDGTGIVGFDAEPETKLGDLETLDTDPIRNVETIQHLGLEGAIQMKNIMVQAEYEQTDLARETGFEDVTLNGGYAFVSWFVTGETKPWHSDEGEFGQVIPADKKYGAWELAFRYSHINLSHPAAGVYGGGANNMTAALNWYTNSNVRFMLDYTMVDNSASAMTPNFDFSFLQLRTIVSF